MHCYPKMIMDKEDSSFFREEARVAEIDATKGP